MANAGVVTWGDCEFFGEEGVKWDGMLAVLREVRRPERDCRDWEELQKGRR